MVLNSLSSVLTYNIYNFEDKEKKKKFLHQSTFISQLTYFFIFLLLLLGSVRRSEITLQKLDPFSFRLTVSTLLNLKQEMVLLDLHGRHHNLPISVVHHMLALGWGFFFLGWVMNIIFYGVHPCDVSLSPTSIKDKLPNSLSLPIPTSPTSLKGSDMNPSDGKTESL